ncbi:hypothetical protein Tco_0418746 [Tanacetum coccineum]
MAEGEIDNLTMEQYLALNRGNQTPNVVKPEIRGNVNFEIKNQFMRELREATFFKNKNNDAHEHVERVLDIPLRDGWTDFLQEPSIPETSLKKPLSKGTVHHQRLLSSLKKSATSSRKEKKHYSKLGSDIWVKEEENMRRMMMMKKIDGLNNEKGKRKWQSMVLEMKIEEIVCSKKEVPARV